MEGEVTGAKAVPARAGKKNGVIDQDQAYDPIGSRRRLLPP